ncbi:cobalamin biosynthesis protein CobQ [Roseovarius sp. ZX-A-9]|uniref:cobalamin biosynthesis protein CobQ n=1 Tax=Roseovarius sp. ZX-A-9 TaxID=3014783 RepID=UPI00232ADA1E|nr:cobalamin biosynthesis protein CobQ [Roseovarius sp. ZX-A-9]
MNTPAHLIFAAAAFAKPGAPRRTWAAPAGALAPDLSLYVMSIWALYVQGLDPGHVFGTLYFSDSWQNVFRVDNSFLVWGALLAICWWRGSAVGMVFTASALLHLAFDFPLHHDDGRPHFWPLSDWVFQSPISYWDRGHYGAIIGPLEMAACVLLLIVLFRRFDSLRSRAFIALAATIQILPVFIWVFVFAADGG